MHWQAQCHAKCQRSNGFKKIRNWSHVPRLTATHLNHYAIGLYQSPEKTVHVWSYFATCKPIFLHTGLLFSDYLGWISRPDTKFQNSWTQTWNLWSIHLMAFYTESTARNTLPTMVPSHHKGHSTANTTKEIQSEAWHLCMKTPHQTNQPWDPLQTASELYLMVLYQQRLQNWRGNHTRCCKWHGEAPLGRVLDDPSKQQPAQSVLSWTLCRHHRSRHRNVRKRARIGWRGADD